MTTLSFAAPVQHLIQRVEERMAQQAEGYNDQLYQALTQLMRAGGKRVRPTVSLLVGGMLDVDTEHTITVAAAVEMLHTATLVHDDLIDGATTRRGKATLNTQWNSSATILAGDFLFSRAASLGAEVNNIQVMQHFARALSTIVNGEINQIFSRNHIASREEYYERIYAKTASMFELAARAPGYLSEVNEQRGEALMAYGYGIGVAFQLVDDALDFSSDAETMGKPVASDLRIGLMTMPSLCYQDEHPDDDRLQRLQNAETMGDAEMDALVEDIRSSGAVDYTLEAADGHIQDAIDALQGLPDGPERQALIELAEYVVERKH